ncbi:MAG: hypothetical protein ABI758_03955 [Candidatus Woesebacteria bacterium]
MELVSLLKVGGSIKVAILIGVVSFLILQLLFPTSSPYDYYTRLSSAFLSGRICLADNPPWLNELVTIPNVGYCVVYPIAPALLLLPFVALSPQFSQTLGAHIFFGLSSAIVYLLFRRYKKNHVESIIFSLAWSFGTIFLSMSAVGSSWYIAQTIGACFALLSLLVFDEKKPRSFLLTGICISIAAISRLPLHLYVLYFCIRLLWQYKKNWKKLLLGVALLALGFIPLFTIQRLYNFARYKTFGDLGYYLIPGKFNEEDFKDGEFNIKNIPKHAEVLFTKLPKKIDTFPYIVPSHYGLSIFITSPFLILAFLSLLRKKRWPELATIGLIMLLEMSHGTVGFAQFGYRFALDVYPLLFLGFTVEKKTKRFWILFGVLLLFSVIVNLWGLLAFRNDWFIW